MRLYLEVKREIIDIEMSIEFMMDNLKTMIELNYDKEYIESKKLQIKLKRIEQFELNDILKKLHNLYKMDEVE